MSNSLQPLDCSQPSSLSLGFSRQEYWSGWGMAIPFSRGSSWPRDRTQLCCFAGRFFTIWAIREAPKAHLSCWSLKRSMLYKELNIKWITNENSSGVESCTLWNWQHSFTLGCAGDAGIDSFICLTGRACAGEKDTDPKSEDLSGAQFPVLKNGGEVATNHWVGCENQMK